MADGIAGARRTVVARCAVALVLAVAGCSGRTAAPVMPSTQSQSWMRHEAQSGNLLYVSASNSDVYVLTYPGYRIVGTLSGFSEVTGLCSDHNGDVFIGNSATSTVVEYAHGGTVPIATLNDPNEYPLSCAVDPQNGDLAVANMSIDGQSGNLAIYKHASGSPAMYDDSDFDAIQFLSYGPQSQIFFDGLGRGDKFAMGRFSGGAFTPILLRGGPMPPNPGGIQYAGGALTTAAPGNGDTALIYRMNDSGVVESETHLLKAYDCQGYLIRQSLIICPSGYGDLRVYRYPQGGSLIKEVPLWHYGIIQVALSVAPK